MNTGSAAPCRVAQFLSLLAAVALAAPGARTAAAFPRVTVEGGSTVVRETGPRPARVWALESPFRLVMDFPGAPLPGYGAFPRTVSLDLPGVIGVRVGRVASTDGPHSRLTVVLVRKTPFESDYSHGTWTLRLAVEPDPGAKPFVAVTPMHLSVAPRAAATPALPAASRPGKSRAPLEIAAAALGSGDLEGASAALAGAAGSEDNDRRAPLLSRLALAEARGKRPADRVEAHAREAVERGSESVDLDVCLGRSLDRLGRREEAARWYRRATQLPVAQAAPATERCAAFFLWADALYRSGQTVESLAAYDEALSACPDSPERSWALYQAAKLEQRAGHTTAARARVSELVAHFPGDYWAQRAREMFAPQMASELR